MNASYCNLSILIFTNGQDNKKNLFHIFHFTVMEDLLLGPIISNNESSVVLNQRSKWSEINLFHFFCHMSINFFFNSVERELYLSNKQEHFIKLNLFKVGRC